MKPTRPKARPSAAPSKSKRPPKKMPMFDAPSPREEEPMKKAKGGMVCRGGGKATKGKGYSKAG